MSAPKATVTTNFRDVPAKAMHPETAMHSLPALFTGIRVLLEQDEIDQAAVLATVGEHLADELTDRI